MEDVTRCTGISTFPYCLKVFLNLWTRPMDLSCRGSTSAGSYPGSPLCSCDWCVGLDCGFSCGGWGFGRCASLQKVEVDSQRWPVGGDRDRRRAQQQNAAGGSRTLTPTSNGRVAANRCSVPWFKMRCIIILSLTSSLLLWCLPTG